MKQHQGFTFAFFNVLELARLFYFVYQNSSLER
jgi:hypothetical protein